MLRHGPADEWIDGAIAGSLAVLEGLPYPGWEKELLDREPQRADLVRIALMFDREVRRRVNLRDPRKFVRELESCQQNRSQRPRL